MLPFNAVAAPVSAFYLVVCVQFETRNNCQLAMLEAQGAAQDLLTFRQHNAFTSHRPSQDL